MRRQFLRILATLTFRHAWLMFPLVVFLTASAVWMASQMKFDTSLVAFLPASASQDRNIGELVSDYRKLEPVMVQIRAREAGREMELILVARELAHLLDHPRFFSTPVYKVDELAQTYYESLSDLRLIQLLTADDWSELKRLMTESISANRLKKLMAYRQSAFLPPRLNDQTRQDPLGALSAIRNRLASSRGPTRLGTRGGYFLSEDRQAMTILLYPVVSPENGRDAINALSFVEDCQKFLMERHPSWQGAYEINFEGPLVATARQLRNVEDELHVILTIAAPLLLLLILLVFRKVEAIFFILLPPAVGLAWTLGLAQWAFGGISAVTAAFLLIILAIGLQYSIHLYHRFILELYRTHNYYRALSRSYVETGRGILASAVVVALLFFSLMVTSLHGVEDWRDLLHTMRDSRGFGRLGVVAGCGILCNLAACLLSLPLLASVKSLLARGRIKPVALYRFGLENLFGPAIANPRATLIVMLLLGVLFGQYARDLDFYPRFAAISPFFLRSEAAAPEATNSGFPRPGRPIIAVVHGRTWQEALERNDQLYENLRGLGGDFNILSYDSIRTALPSLRSQQASLATLLALDLEPFRRHIQTVSRASGFNPIVYEPFIQALESFKKMASQPQYIEYVADADEELISTVQRYITRKENGYYVTTAIYPQANGFDPRRLTELSSSLSRGIGKLTLIGDPIVERDLSRMVKFNLAIMILLSIFIIFLTLILHYRSPRLAWLTFLPVLAEIVWLCGIMALTGLQIHFFTVLVMPLVLCLAMDNALQVTQYYTDRQPCSVRHAMLSIGRVIMLTCGAMALLYGTLALGSYTGLRDLGVVVLYGSGAVLIGTAMLLPALLKLFGQGQPLLSAIRIDNEN